MSLFDKFCKITERKILPTHEEDFYLLESARIFHIDGNIILEKDISVNENDLFLPFPVIALYNEENIDKFGDGFPEKVTFYFDPTECIGADCKRYFIDISLLRSDPLDNINDLIIIGTGIIEKFNIDADGCCSADINGKRIFVINSDTLEFTEFGKIDDELTNDIKNYIDHAFESVAKGYLIIAKINSIKNMIVEKRFVKEKKRRKNKLQRHHERPEYIILKSKEVRKYVGMPEFMRDEKTGRKTPIPHGVRAHYRTLNKGTEHERRTFIKAYWKGPSESIKGNRKYRVLLDPEDFKQDI